MNANSRNRKKGIQTRLGLELAGFVVLTACVISALLFLHFKTTMRQTAKEQLLDMLNLAVTQVDAYLNEEPLFEGDPAYRKLENKLHRLLASAPDLQRVYTLMLSSNRLVYGAAVSKSSLRAVRRPGQPFERDHPRLHAISGLERCTFVDRNFLVANNETLLSGFAPLTSPDGQSTGWLAMDISVSRIIRRELRFFVFMLTAFTLVLMLATGLGGYFMFQIGEEARKINAALNAETLERARAEATLLTSEEKFRAMIETSSDIIWEMDPEGRYTYVSPKILDFLGMAPEGQIGRFFFDDLPLRDHDPVAVQFKEASNGKKPFEGLHLSAVPLNGKNITTFEMNGIPFFDAHGSLLGYRGVSRDITDRMRVNREMKDSQANLASLIESTDSIIAAFDRQSRFILFNSACFRLMKSVHKVEIGAGIDIQSFMPEDRRQLFAASARRALQGEVFHVEYAIPQPEGGIQYLNLSFHPIAREDQIAGFSIFGVDITRHRQMEQELRDSLNDLERFSKAMIGREQRVMELKAEVNELLAQLELPWRYQTAGNS